MLNSPWLHLATMLVMLIGSASVFTYLVWRETHRRRDSVLHEWARERRFKKQSTERGVAEPVGTWLREAGVSLVIGYVCGRTAVLRVRTTGTSRTEADAPGTGESLQWHVLIRSSLDGDHALAALRGADVSRSVIDLLPIEPLPGQSARQRFVCFGEHASGKRLLAHAAGLVPPDMSLIAQGPWLVLDFSGRPFDPVELSRVIAVIDQVEAVWTTPSRAG